MNNHKQGQFNVFLGFVEGEIEPLNKIWGSQAETQ